jgi:hypothetical protein
VSIENVDVLFEGEFTRRPTPVEDRAIPEENARHSSTGELRNRNSGDLIEPTKPFGLVCLEIDRDRDFF